MPISGTEFESLVKPFFKNLFEEMGFSVFEVRNQTSGTQNGFDIKVVFQDEEGNDRSIFIECKYYESRLSFSEIVTKIIQLNGSNYTPDAFIALSPKENISNIDDNLKEQLEGSYKFPSEFWTPDTDVENLFALNKDLYKKVYDKDCKIAINREKQLTKIKERIKYLLAKRETLAISDIISIQESNQKLEEAGSFRTNLDDKLDAVFEPHDEKRIKYHQLRCNYKFYLEELQDVNNVLRNKIMDWQNNLRLKAERLTGQFNTDPEYTPAKFFYQFFNDAELSLKTFYQGNNLTGDEEKLLYGVVLELAAECPLDWRPNSK